ncbi:hypothetical protein JCM31271_02940 [Halorubrum trueperi]
MLGAATVTPALLDITVAARSAVDSRTADSVEWSGSLTGASATIRAIESALADRAVAVVALLALVGCWVGAIAGAHVLARIAART